MRRAAAPGLALAAAFATLPLTARAQTAPPPPPSAQTVDPVVIEAAPPGTSQPQPQAQPYPPAPPPTYLPYPVAPVYYNTQAPYVPRRRIVVPYDGGAIPPGAQVHTRRPIAAIAVSGGGFVIAYIVSAYYSVFALYGGGASVWGMVPLVGPWIALSDGVTAQRAGAFYVIDGLVQGVGFTLAMVALQIRHRELVMYQPVSGRRRGVEWAALPMVSGYGAGLGVVGAF